MQKVVFVFVGRVKTDWIAEGIKHFLFRLDRQMDLTMAELVPSKNVDPMKQREEESRVILKKLDSIDGDVWLLDEKGEGMTSVEFSSALSKEKDKGRTIIFVLGGAYGVSDEVRARSKKILQLSQMTRGLLRFDAYFSIEKPFGSVSGRSVVLTASLGAV
jgi:23S rRNA (pseudouridine1915-N3)-methyltransferase